MRTLLLALVIALVAATPAAAATKNVKVGDDFFKAKSITVHKGTTVRWNWKGHDAHNVVVQKGPAHFQSSLKTKGHFAKKLKKKGTYKIICSIHAPEMRMTIKVR